MAITQTAISYYGMNYVEHAECDFKEMIEHGCTTVILAVTEFDFNFWRPNIPKIVDAAHKLGLRVLLDPGHRQVFRRGAGEPLPAKQHREPPGLGDDRRSYSVPASILRRSATISRTSA